jgi:hypothetical protein
MWVAVLEDDSLFGSVVARRPSSAGEGTEEEGGEGGGGGAEGARSGAQGEEGSPAASDLDGMEDEEVEEEEGKEREEREEGAEREFLRRMEEEHVAAAVPPSSRPVAPAPAPALPVEDKSSSTDPWEMVQGSSNLYPASSASRLRKESGRDASAKATHEGAKKPKKSKKTKSLSERVLDAVDACNWPLSTEYAETGEYNRLVSAPFPPGDDTDDAVGRDIGRTFPEHPQVIFEFFEFFPPSSFLPSPPILLFFLAHTHAQTSKLPSPSLFRISSDTPTAARRWPASSARPRSPTPPSATAKVRFLSFI